MHTYATPQKKAANTSAAPGKATTSNPLQRKANTGNPLQMKTHASDPTQAYEDLEKPWGGNAFQLKANEAAATPPAQQPVMKNNTGLPDSLKAGVESLSGFSMDDVKVHYNSGKPIQVQALAYAQGTHIHVSPGQEKHLAHEAWHVAQQKQGRVQPTLQMKAGVNVNDNKGLEKEADEMGMKALQFVHLSHSSGQSKLQNTTANDLSIKQSTQADALMGTQVIQKEELDGRYDEHFTDLSSMKPPPMPQSGFGNFLSEFGAGLMGYSASYVKEPSDTLSPKVLADPTRKDFGEKLNSDAPMPQHIRQQLKFQNTMQAHFGNALPPNGGNALIDGLKEMGQAKDIEELKKGHTHAQMNSLGIQDGKEGFTTAAPHILHRAAILWQQPNLELHNEFSNTPLSDPNHPFPVRDTSRAIFDKADKNPTASTFIGAGLASVPKLLKQGANVVPKQLLLPMMIGAGIGAMVSQTKSKLEDIEKGK